VLVQFNCVYSLKYTHKEKEILENMLTFRCVYSRLSIYVLLLPGSEFSVTL
jgi:hypothetical protein